jgi:tetratricopeptide (TPR) repeat protein
MAPDDLPEPLLSHYHEALPEPLAIVAGDPLALADSVAALRRYSLVRVVADGIFVHRLLQTVVRTSLDRETEQAWAACAVRLLHAGFPAPKEGVASWPESERLLPHLLAVVAHGERLGVEPESWMWLLTQAGFYLWGRGQFRQALALEEHSLAVRHRVLGPEHPDTLLAMNNLAETRRDLGDLDGARQLHEQALASCRQVLGEDHPNTLTSMSNLALTLAALGNLDGARELHLQTFAARRRVLGDDHPDTLSSMNNLAEVRRALGDLDGARTLLEQALAGRQRALGDDHPDTLSSMNNLAAVKQQLEEA